MTAELEEKTDRYGELLTEAVEDAEIAAPARTPMADAATECRRMAEAYLEDGRHFRDDGDLVNALAAFSYGHAWLDAGARIGLFRVSTDEQLFAV